DGEPGNEKAADDEAAAIGLARGGGGGGGGGRNVLGGLGQNRLRLRRCRLGRDSRLGGGLLGLFGPGPTERLREIAGVGDLLQRRQHASGARGLGSRRGGGLGCGGLRGRTGCGGGRSCAAGR